MRFPLALSLKIARHIISNKLRRTPRFALVLQLEPLHACNLKCTGCGRIREYSTSLKDLMSLEDCLGSARECGAPMVSVCGGEPLLYPQIEELVSGLLDQGRIVYICTNGVVMRRKLGDLLATWPGARREALLQELRKDELVSPEEADRVRQGRAEGKPVIAPSKWLYWNVHLDGLERSHDQAVEKEGVFRECIAAIRMAKALGFQVATNTTAFRETDMDEIEQMFEFLSSLGVDGHTISPGYDFDAAKRDLIDREGQEQEDYFLTRSLTRQKFARLDKWTRRFNIFGTPVYHEFLQGKRELTCTAWAIPTRNVAGWKAPCYLMTDDHYERYDEMLEKVDWDKYGGGDGAPLDPRCEDCMVHCGYDPSGALGRDYQRGDLWKNIKYNLGPRPKRSENVAKVDAFNGVSVGRGHLSGGGCDGDQTESG